MSHLNRSSRPLGPLFALISFLGGCQPLDSGAALGEPFKAEAESTSAALGKPALELEDGSVANDACDAVRTQAYQILDRTCGNCHGGGAPGARQGTPPFEAVLDEERMMTMFSSTAKDPETLQPARFLVAGDPDHSRVYLRPMNGEMPPPDVVGLPKNPRPSASDLSVLRHWIKSCIQTSDTSADVGRYDTQEPSITH
ncbi:MAG TPA: hypothetical protein VFN67_34730 [Polyangiales bacterium]|nr:hypothetical protein [Polyangiales bacterium]